jgi:hypothetical protein
VKNKTAREIWTRKHLDARADDLIADVVNRIANDRRWLDGFVPDPTTYLNQERWDDELTKGRARPNSTPSKTMQALTSLQDMKHGQQQPSFDLEPDAETGVPGPRRPAGR